MDAILNTWGRYVEKAVILSNTPKDLPVNKIATHSVKGIAGTDNATTTSWKVQKVATLNGGRSRPPKESWGDIFKVMANELRLDPGLQWIVRSDSDT